MLLLVNNTAWNKSKEKAGYRKVKDEYSAPRIALVFLMF